MKQCIFSMKILSYKTKKISKLSPLIFETYFSMLNTNIPVCLSLRSIKTGTLYFEQLSQIKVYSLCSEHLAPAPILQSFPSQLSPFVREITNAWHVLQNNSCPKSPQNGETKYCLYTAKQYQVSLAKISYPIIFRIFFVLVHQHKL